MNEEKPDLENVKLAEGPLKGWETSYEDFCALLEACTEEEIKKIEAILGYSILREKESFSFFKDGKEIPSKDVWSETQHDIGKQGHIYGWSMNKFR